MRIFIVIVAVSLAPAGMWIAGCREESRQAAFPNSSEMEALAKAPVSAPDASATPPVIRPAKIDKGILNLPDAPTMARVNAVKDRSRRLAQPKAPDDLFALPDTAAAPDERYAMAAPAPYEAAPAAIAAPAPAPAAIAPIPSAREFWSRPVAPVAPSARRSRSLTVPDDISAMAAPGSAATDTNIIPPAPYLAPIPSNAGGQFFPEDVPGIFTGAPLSMQSGGPPSPSGRVRHDGYAGYNGGDARSAAPSSSNRGGSNEGGLFTLNLDGLIGESRSRSSAAMDFMPSAPTAVPMPDNHVSHTAMIDRTIVVQSIPGNYEPLPEPVPLEDYVASMASIAPAPFAVASPVGAKPAAAVSAPPVPAALKMDAAAPVVAPRTAPAAAPVPVSFNALTAQPPIPSARKAGAAKADIAKAEKAIAVSSAVPSFFDAGDVKAALAPLPDIAGDAKAKTSLHPPVMAKKEAAEKEIARKESARAADTAKNAMAKNGKEDEKIEAFAESDVFRMDFWDQKPPLMKAAAIEKVTPKPASTEKADAKTKTPAPKKITLRPIRRADSTLGKIDSEAEAPPLKF